MSLEEMAAATGVERDRIKELEGFGIVCAHGPEGGRYYDGDDYVTLSIVKDFLRFGIEPRHLTMYKHFADRESAFFEALVAPTLRQKNPMPAGSARPCDLTVTTRKFKQALLRTPSGAPRHVRLGRRRLAPRAWLPCCHALAFAASRNAAAPPRRPSRPPSPFPSRSRRCRMPGQPASRRGCPLVTGRSCTESPRVRARSRA
jgi:hypothetical protein